MIPKIKRIENEGLLLELRQKPCFFCKKASPSEVHHIKSRKSGGDDERWNCIPVCRICHTECHKRGLFYMMNKYLDSGAILAKMGWNLAPWGRMRFTKKEL